MTQSRGLRMAIDIGGTFTDTAIVDANARVVATCKVPTTPDAPVEAALSGAQEALTAAGASMQEIDGFIHGTTLATNAHIEKRGARVATVTTEGFRDILEIAYERRYSQYAINLVKPDLLVPRSRAFTIGGRMDARRAELIPLDEAAVADLADRLREARVEAVAICLLHAYANPAHERRLAELLQQYLPGTVVSLSHEISPEAREFDRLCTTIANAYIQPLMSRYLADFERKFAENGLRCPVLMMTAGGGMTTLETAVRMPVRLVESGPAGGAVLAARIAQGVKENEILSFDMGGTTAKLCLIDEYRPQMARRFEIARAARFIKGSGMPVRIPVIEMIEIGAGGGSVAAADDLGRVTVGPQSAGSEPGPAGFGKGGTQPTVTDADIIQGYIPPDGFAEGRLQVSSDLSAEALLGDVGTPLNLTVEEAATAVSEIVDEAMASAGRMHAVESGKDISSRLMIAFGGNGPLHATRVARRAGISRILIPPDPGVGSAVGFLFAPVSFEIIRSRYTRIDRLEPDQINALFDDMIGEAEAVVRAGAPESRLYQRRTAYMRYHGQGHEIEVDLGSQKLISSDRARLIAAFEQEYSRQFGRVVPGMITEVLNWGVSVWSDAPVPPSGAVATSGTTKSADTFRQIWCSVTSTWRKAGVFQRSELSAGDEINGPALICEPQTTTLVTADFSARTDADGNIWLTSTGERGQ
ncbi:hydantoinase/oxoprolinase family protein [uncultured Roseobacter sp.]|uniref:hydantoinase/oxoprolinase family protein n=1 Tax=uncultured Roseobacter sp. TaxID=114847 RepID=UPI00261D525A|nr:hydantoinase/oxoprolinase family protein [uncultured Roseobacter sp.]